MSLLAPAALGLLSLAIPLVVLYMLRSRRRVVEVPSLLLWEGEEENVAAALPWQRLTITAALILQLLALALFALALARPFASEATLLGPHTVIVIDTSGSMAKAGRLEAAQATARDMVADASEEHLVSLVDGGPRPRVLAAFSRDRVGLAAAIDTLAPTGGSEDLAGALRLARGLATPDRPSVVVFLSDGGVEGALPEPVVGARHVAFDRDGDDYAITGLGVTAGEGAARVFVEVSSFAIGIRQVMIELSVDGIPAGVEDFTLEGGAKERRVVPVDAGPGQVVTARLLDAEGRPLGDALALDDESAAVLVGGLDLTAAIVGPGSVFIEALLDSVDGIVPAAGAPPDMVVIDRADASVIDRPAWVIFPTQPPPGVSIVGRVDFPVVSFQRPGEPILEGVDLSELVIVRADVVVAPGWLPIVSAGDVPLILLGEVDGHRVVYFTFDLTASNLPVDVAFPVMGTRLLEWLAGGRGVAAAVAPAGTPIEVVPPPGTTPQVTMPSGDVRVLDPALRQFLDTGAPGVYRVAYVDEGGEAVASFSAARQFVASEAAAEPRQILTALDPLLAAEEEGTLLREWAPWILGLLVLLVLIEWWVAAGRPRPTWRRREPETEPVRPIERRVA